MKYQGLLLAIWAVVAAAHDRRGGMISRSYGNGLLGEATEEQRRGPEIADR